MIKRQSQKVDVKSSFFGKAVEYDVIGKMLKEGLDVYVPAVDNKGIDAIIRRPNGTFIEAQIKARSKDKASFFGPYKPIGKPRPNYWYIFVSEGLDKMWIFSSAEFEKLAATYGEGKHKGKRYLSIPKGDTEKRVIIDKYVASDFSRLLSSIQTL